MIEQNRKRNGIENRMDRKNELSYRKVDKYNGNNKTNNKNYK